jgi:hypothetical protein
MVSQQIFLAFLKLTSSSCAALNGVPPEIIQRAENLILLSMRGEDLVAACCQMPEDEAAELEEAVSKHIRSMTASNLSEGADSERLSRSGRVSRSEDNPGGHTDDIYDHGLSELISIIYKLISSNGELDRSDKSWEVIARTQSN